MVVRRLGFNPTPGAPINRLREIPGNTPRSRRIERRERYDGVSALDPAPIHHCCGICLWSCGGILGNLRTIEPVSPQPYPAQTIQHASPGAYGKWGLESFRDLVEPARPRPKAGRKTLLEIAAFGVAKNRHTSQTLAEKLIGNTG